MHIIKSVERPVSRREAGRIAEKVAASYLEKSGYKIVAWNYKGERYEVDLIVRQNNTLVFVEVRSAFWGSFSPSESIDERKRRRIRAASLEFLENRPALRHLEKRFDVIVVRRQAVSTDRGSSNVHHVFRIEHIEGAF